MSRFRIIGMDWFDVVVHVGVTFMAGVAADALLGGRGSDIGVSLVVAASLILLGYRRQRALARLPDAPAEIGRVDDLESRVGELEQMHDRVSELEERLDFAERMLGQHREQERLPRV